MPFLLIRGTFHLVGKNKKGKPTGFQPDGDSIHFKPKKKSRLDELPRRKNPYRLSGIGSVNLRFEGIDTPELHYLGWRQPAPLAEQARDFLLEQIRVTNVQYKENGVTVDPPVHDGQQGFILSKELDVHGRPVSFVFVGAPDDDGEWIHLTPSMTGKSLNYKLLKQGYAYPLFYDSLYADLRQVMTAAAKEAQRNRRGIWQTRPTEAVRLKVNDVAHQISPTIYPKLFRRLRDYFAAENAGLSGLAAWMNEKGENDEVWQLPEWNRTHFDNVLKIQGNKIALQRDPLNLVFVSRK